MFEIHTSEKLYRFLGMMDDMETEILVIAANEIEAQRVASEVATEGGVILNKTRPDEPREGGWIAYDPR